MSLHAISVFDKMYKIWMKPWKKLHLKSTIKCFKKTHENMQVTRNTILISPQTDVLE